MHICRFCGEYGRDDDLVKYGIRHYAHHACYLDAGRKLDQLRKWQVQLFSWKVLSKRGLLDEAERLTA